VVNETGKEAVVAILDRVIFLGKVALRPDRFAWRPRPAIAPTTVRVIEKNEDASRAAQRTRSFPTALISYMWLGTSESRRT